MAVVGPRNLAGRKLAPLVLRFSMHVSFSPLALLMEPRNRGGNVFWILDFGFWAFGSQTGEHSKGYIPISTIRFSHVENLTVFSPTSSLGGGGRLHLLSLTNGFFFSRRE